MRSRRNEDASIWAHSFRGSLKGILRASFGIAAENAPSLSSLRNKVRGREGVKMKRLMFGVGVAALILLSGCTTPVRIKTTGSNGSVQEIEVRDSTGKVIEIGNSSKEKIDKLVPAIEKEIVKVLNGKVAEKDFKGKYEIL